MSMRETLRDIVLASAIVLAGCSKPGDYIEGRVIGEYGNITRIVESSGVPFANEFAKFGKLSYGINAETPQGVYTIEVDIGDRFGSSGPHTAYNLATAIEEGTKIRFPLRYGGKDLFSADRLGVVDPDDIQILRE